MTTPELSEKAIAVLMQLIDLAGRQGRPVAIDEIAYPDRRGLGGLAAGLARTGMIVVGRAEDGSLTWTPTREGKAVAKAHARAVHAATIAD